MSTPLVSDERNLSERIGYAAFHLEQTKEPPTLQMLDSWDAQASNYEAELQSMRERLSRMEEAGNAMARMFVKFEEEKRELGWMPTANDWDSMRNLASMWNAALSNK